MGISTGGVAEVFETYPDGDEAIVLKSRQGLVRLAFRTGSALVPCYLLGNTHLLSLWCGGAEHSAGRRCLQWISRKLGNMVLFHDGIHHHNTIYLSSFLKVSRLSYSGAVFYCPSLTVCQSWDLWASLLRCRRRKIPQTRKSRLFTKY